jgi:hypothetical protein
LKPTAASWLQIESTTMQITKQQAYKAAKFTTTWLRAVVPGVKNIRIQNGTVAVRDTLGWRDMGQLADYVAIARALGRL